MSNAAAAAARCSAASSTLRSSVKVAPDAKSRRSLMDLHTQRAHNERRQRSTWGMSRGASRRAGSVSKLGTEAGTHIGAIAGCGACDLWLLCMVDATRVRRAPHRRHLRYMLCSRALAF